MIRSSVIIVVDTLAELSQLDSSEPVVFCLETNCLCVRNGTWGQTAASIAEGNLVFSDVTTGNASATKHGLLPKLPNTATKFLRDDGTFQTIAGGGDMLKSTYDPNDDGKIALAQLDTLVQSTAEKNGANGYAGLSAASKLTLSQMTGLLASTDLTNDAALEKVANKNSASGYAGLDGSSKVNGAQQVYGAAANTATEGNDPRLLSNVERIQRVLRSLLPASGTFLCVSGTAYFVYLGRTVKAITPKFVEFQVSTAGAGTQTAEIGLFSTPNPPSKATQSLTKLVSTGTVDSVTTTGVKRNTSAFNTQISAGVHLWAGVRFAMATTQPTAAPGLQFDKQQGAILVTASAAALTGAGPWSGALTAVGTATVCPDLTVTMD